MPWSLMLRIVLFLLGALLVATTVRSAVRTFILPRASNTLIARWVFRAVGTFFRWRVNREVVTEFFHRSKLFWS